MKKTAAFAFSFLLLFFIPFCFKAVGSTALRFGEAEGYLTERIPESNKRHFSFMLALLMLKDRCAKTLVETGTSRDGDQNFIWDGGSTIIFSHWASQNQAMLYSVDIDPFAIGRAFKVTRSYADHIQLVCSDSVKFLEHFQQPIDFLYLDSYDFDFNDPAPSQNHHLREIIAVYPALHEASVVMIDDCDLPFGGKGKLVIEFLLERGWKIVYKGYQTILVQSD